MNPEWLIVSAWLAFVIWALGECFLAVPKGAGQPWVRVGWSLGAGLLTWHLGLALEFHQWSHAAAVRETARQTQELFGWDWGGGVWFNYLLVAWWWVDCGRSWLARASWNSRGTGLWLRRGFFFFMWFNGTVVFAAGGRRLLALAVCILVLGCWGRAANVGKLRVES